MTFDVLLAYESSPCDFAVFTWLLCDDLPQPRISGMQQREACGIGQVLWFLVRFYASLVRRVSSHSPWWLRPQGNLPTWFAAIPAAYCVLNADSEQQQDGRVTHWTLGQRELSTAQHSFPVRAIERIRARPACPFAAVPPITA